MWVVETDTEWLTESNTFSTGLLQEKFADPCTPRKDAGSGICDVMFKDQNSYVDPLKSASLLINYQQSVW